MLLLDQGRVVLAGTPVEVLDREVLGRVFRWPVAITTWGGTAPQVIPLRQSELRDHQTP
jgi:ABC-type hemin transport system ATPase subunit